MLVTMMMMMMDEEEEEERKSYSHHSPAGQKLQDLVHVIDIHQLVDVLLVLRL